MQNVPDMTTDTQARDEQEFEAWVASEGTRMHPEGREGYFANNNNFTRDYWIAERTWKAALASERARSAVLIEALKEAENLIDREKAVSAGIVINEALAKLKHDKK